MTYLCIDIGGTKLSWGVSDGDKLYAVQTAPVAKGIPGLLSQLQGCINMSQSSDSRGLLIGTPGNLIKGYIAPGSAENLGTFPGEFDHFSLVTALQPYIKTPIHVFNDAQAQLAGAYLQLRHQLSGVTRIGYVGPGTGLGGGFADLQKGGYVPITDGHIFDILLPCPSGHPHYPGRDTAENLLSGRAFRERTGNFAHTVAVNAPNSYRPLIREFGQTLATLITHLRTGNLEKTTNKIWSKKEIQFVQGVTHYLIGGGLGTAAPFGAWLIADAQNYLQLWKEDITLIPIPNVREAGLLGLVFLTQRICVF